MSDAIVNFADLPISALVQALNFTPPLVFECAFLATRSGAWSAGPERISALMQAAEETPITTSIAISQSEMAVAAALVEERYESRGFQPDDSASTDFHVAEDWRPGYFPILAYAGETPVGTVTLGLDGDDGLFAEEGNAEVIAELRASGKRLCEIVRLAVDEGAQSRRTLAALFNATYGLIRVHDATDLVIEVNPRHVPFYKRSLGFEVIGEERICPRVSAPSVLLRLDIDLLAKRIENLQASLGDMPL